jgi:hypothetical protein
MYWYVFSYTDRIYCLSYWGLVLLLFSFLDLPSAYMHDDYWNCLPIPYRYYLLVVA